MVNGMLTILLDIGSNINIMCLRTAQTFEQVSRFHGRAIKKLSLTRLCVSGVGHGAAVCDESMRCTIACKEQGGPAGAPAVPRLDTYQASVAEGSGGYLLPAILRLRNMSNMRAILILGQGHEK
eukprot:8111926-Pyramimonas_sp.AAC.1